MRRTYFHNSPLSVSLYFTKYFRRKIMKYNYCLVLIIAVCIYASYANIQNFNASLAGEEFAAVVNDYVNKAQNRGLVNEKSPADREKNSLASGNSSQEQTKILDDNSKLNTMYDGSGNKTEARCFNNHPRLTCVVLSSAVNGKRQVLVYGQNGDIKELPEDMIDKVTTASGDEIANSAGVYAARQQTTQSAYAQTTPVPTLPATVRPTEGSQSSLQNSPGAQIKNENADASKSTTAGSEIKSSPAIGKIQPKENEKSSASNRQP